MRHPKGGFFFGKILLIIGFMAGSIFFFTRVADNSETLEGYTGNDLTKNIIVSTITIVPVQDDDQL